MGPERLQAFSDGVIAIIITIMVLEMKVPHSADLSSLKPVIPIFMSYILSFIYVGIYWNNHHHMMHTIHHVNGRVLWANTHLLFWLSLIPFASGWMGENHFAKWPVVVYGVVVCMAGIAYYFLSQSLLKLHGKDSRLGLAIGNDRKGITSVIIYVMGIGLCFIHPWLGVLLYSLVAAMWFIPDGRIEKKMKTG
ncbi:MAG TPA: TMEM175 family protein [Chitinophagaceae bacterium]|nr:TMEM175 family protein [Chitinophagaceae bacterium]